MADILIFDDDPSIGDLAGDLLRGRGLTVEHFRSGAGVVDMVRQAKPRLVVLDIMMPGMDGLSACKEIRSNPSTRGVKIVVMTAKTHKKDRDLAERYGADDFLNKPFDPQAFARTIGRLLQLPAESDGARPPAPPTTLTLLPSGAALQTPGLWVLFDAGRGLQEWMAGQSAPSLAWLLLTRFDGSCVTELESVGALLSIGTRVNIGGPDDPECNLQFLAPRVIPARTRSMPLLYPQRESEFRLNAGIQAAAQFTQHPGPTLAYRVDMQGKRIVYCPAHEIDRKEWKGFEMQKFRQFFSKADLLLFGFRRAEKDPKPHDDLGGGAWEPAVDLAAEAQVRHLALFPLPGAADIPWLQTHLQGRLATTGSKMKVTAAKAGQVFVL